MDGIKYRKPEEMRDSGVEWFGAAPTDWVKAKLKYIALVRNGATPQTSVPEYWDGNICWFTPTDFGRQNLFESTRTITSKGLNSCGTNLVPKGSILITCRAPIGNLGIVDCEIAAYNQGCKGVVPRYVDNKYLFYLCLTSSKFLQSRGKGTTFMELSNFDLNNLIIEIPDEQEQQKIAKFLDIKTSQFDSVIAQKELFIQKLEEAKKSLISEVVTGKVKIVNSEMVKRQPEEMKDSGVEWLGMIPEDWEVGTIGKFYSIQLGKMLQPNRKSKTETLEYYLCSANVSWDGIRTDLLKQMWFTPQERKKYLLNRGDLLVTEGGDVGVACIWNNEIEGCYIQNALHKVTHLEMSTNKFLYYWLFTLKTHGYTDLICNKATISHFTKEKFSKSLFLLPSRSEQKAIIDFLNDQCFQLDYFKTQNVKVIEKLKQAKQSLISEAVTGKIDLRDWEIIEEGGVQ